MCVYRITQTYMSSVSLERSKAEGTIWDRKVKQDTWSQSISSKILQVWLVQDQTPMCQDWEAHELLTTAVHGLQDSLGVLTVPAPPVTPELEPTAGSSSALLTLPQLCSQANHSCSALLYEPSLGAESVPTHSNSRFNRFVKVGLTAPLIATLRTQEASNLFLLNSVLCKL